MADYCSRPTLPRGHCWFSLNLLLTRSALAIFLCSIIASQALTAHAAPPPRLFALPDSVPAVISNAQLIGPHRANDPITLGLLLQLTHQDEMDQLMAALYTPHGPLYHHWLATGEFDRLFGPTSQQLALVNTFLRRAGLQLSSDSPSSLLVLASGTTRQVEAALGTQINDYRTASGQVFFANSGPVLLPTDLAGTVVGMLGLDSLRVAYPKYRVARAGSPQYGGGPSGSGLTPSQIAGIYNATPVYTKLHEAGQGETLGLFELSSYKRSDIAVYEDQYRLRHVPFVDRPLLGGPTEGTGAFEVELDIELQIALAPGVKSILVYNAPNSGLGTVTQLQQIAKDNLVDALSTSWGRCEDFVRDSPAFTNGEDLAFRQMAMQGQSAFTAAGDNGAYDCSGQSPGEKHGLQVDDSSSPFVTSVGGTSFKGTFDPGSNPHPSYPTGKEHIWSTNCKPDNCEAGGGGGVSILWARPAYQRGLGVDEPKYSRSGAYCHQKAGVPCREVPDVSINADSESGYSLYCTDKQDKSCAGWNVGGGTSCGAPLWAAITALMDNDDQQRFGLLNYFLYSYDSPQGYRTYFHDITLGNNGFYPAGRAYDMASGLGTPDIYQLVQP